MNYKLIFVCSMAIGIGVGLVGGFVGSYCNPFVAHRAPEPRLDIPVPSQPSTKPSANPDSETDEECVPQRPISSEKVRIIFIPRTKSIAAQGIKDGLEQHPWYRGVKKSPKITVRYYEDSGEQIPEEVCVRGLTVECGRTKAMYFPVIHGEPKGVYYKYCLPAPKFVIALASWVNEECDEDTPSSQPKQKSNKSKTPRPTDAI